MESTAGRSTLTRLAWVLALAALGVYAWTSLFGRTPHGFIANHAAARLLITGQLGAQVFDDPWFMTYVRTLTRTDVLDIYGPNTLMMAWLAVPGGGPRAVERPRNLDRCVDRRLRQRAVDRLGVRSSAAWFVGDHPEFDVRGAAEAGLTAVWVRSWAEAAPEATHTISALGELLPLLFAE